MRLYFFFILLLFFSCSENKTSFGSFVEFDNYLNDESNGYISSFETKDLIFETKLIPPIKKENESVVTIRLRIKRIDGLSVLDLNQSGQEERLKIEEYLSFKILKDVYFLSNNKVIPATFGHYERNYGLKPSIDITFDFPKFNTEEETYFIYNDLLFGQGMIKIKYDNQLFKSCDVK